MKCTRDFQSDSWEEQRRTEQEWVGDPRSTGKVSHLGHGARPRRGGGASACRAGWRGGPAAAVSEESCGGQKRPRSGLLPAPTHLWRESRESGASLHTMRHSGWMLSAHRIPAGGLLGPVRLHERQRRSQCCGPRNIRLSGHMAIGKHARFFFFSPS